MSILSCARPAEDFLRITPALSIPGNAVMSKWASAFYFFGQQSF